MVIFNDVVVKQGENPLVELIFKNEKYLNSSLMIAGYKGLVYSGKPKNRLEKVYIPKPPDQLNEYHIIVKRNNKFYNSTLSILQLTPDEPFIVCDIDFTISATNLLYFISKKTIKQKTIYYSIEFLNNISKKYKIIYLTGRLKDHNRVTKMWLKENGFPPGPIFAREKSRNYTQREFKTEILKNICKISKNAVGIGDLASDIHAYMDNGLTAIKIRHPLLYYSKRDDYFYKNGYFAVYSWKGIEKLFLDELLLKEKK
jgi:hypothetical protein